MDDFRAAFPWTSKRRPEIKSLSLTMEQQSRRVPGPHFKTHVPGDSFSFSHPVSGTKYTLTVQELDQQTISHKRVGSDRWFYPTHFTAMSYTLSPKPDDDILIRDCADGDKPLEIAPITNHFAPEAQMILFVSALSAVQMSQPQSCMVTANKKTYMLLALLYTLNQYRMILNGELSLIFSSL